MIKLFRKQTQLEKLQKKYEKLMADWHALSTVNRSQSDSKYAEAELVLQEIESLQKNKNG